jgi:hypothetical protein
VRLAIGLDAATSTAARGGVSTCRRPHVRESVPIWQPGVSGQPLELGQAGQYRVVAVQRGELRLDQNQVDRISSVVGSKLSSRSSCGVVLGSS